MRLRTFLPLLLAVTSVALADPHPGDAGSGARNKDGSIVTGVLTASYDPAGSFSPSIPAGDTSPLPGFQACASGSASPPSVP